MANLHTLTVLTAASRKRLAKQYSSTGVLPYPMVKNFNSREVTITDPATWSQQFVETLKEVSEEGGALLKGQFTTTLVNESRQNKTRKADYNALLVVDIDGLDIPTYTQPLHPEKITEDDIRQITTDTLRLFPEWLRDVHCVVNASASMGIKPGVHLHLFFMLSRKISPKEQKSILRFLNFASSDVKQQCVLTDSKLALHLPIDISMAENSRIIYVATPSFSYIGNPLYPEARFVVIKGSKHTVPVPAIRESIKGIDPKGELNELKAQLRLKEGLPVRALTMLTQKDLLGMDVPVTADVDPMKMVEVADEGDYVRYNIGKGDSKAYWVYKEDPRVVRNFKNEPFFLFEAADPVGYERHCERYPFDEGSVVNNPTIIPFCFYSPSEQTYYVATRSLESNKLLTCYPTPRFEVPNSMRVHGVEDPPDPIPHGDYIFCPDRKEAFDLEERPMFINRFTATSLMAAPPQLTSAFDILTTENVNSAVAKVCPRLFKLLDSIAGCGMEEIAHFINWLAYVYQYRDRAQTLWLFHGVEGTGKGLFMEYVLRPIFDRYVVMKTQVDLEERYNDWMQEALIYVIDEFRLSNSKETKIYNKLKNMATESHVTLRRMHRTGIPVRNFASGIFFSNDIDALSITNHDRRSNIAPRQNMALYKRYPELEDELIPALVTEVPMFAGVLNAMQVDVHKARTPLVNTAKADLQEITQNAQESFAVALAKGDFDYFIESLDVDPYDLANSNESAKIRQILMGRTMLRQALHYLVNAIGEDIVPPVYRAQDILCLYTATGGCARNARALVAEIRAITGMERKSARQPAWQNAACTPINGYPIAWKSKIPIEELKELAAQYKDCALPEFIKEIQ